jgi:processive 1,2-diacylglycerol beta-glucosyltransferase
MLSNTVHCEGTMNQKVLILSEAFGLGHTKIAEGLAQGISTLAPSVHTQVIELGRALHPLTTTLALRSYLKIITKSPILWRKLYRYKQDQPISDRFQFIIHQLFHRKIENLLGQIKPNLVICTHPFSSSSVSRLKRLGYPLNQCTVITDFHAHGAWVQPEVDLYLVSNHEVRQQLIDMGIRKNRVLITGLPLKPNFWIKKNKQEVRRELKLKNLPTIMLMGGGLGLGGIWELAHALMKWKEVFQFVICTGYNQKLERSLLKNERFRHPHIHILGFVDNIDQWMDASDLLITKPGGLTCFEAMFKEIPMLLYQPLSGHEEENCRFLVKNQLAIKIDNKKELDAWVQKMLFDLQEIESLREKIRQFQKKIDPMASFGSILDFLTR